MSDRQLQLTEEEFKLLQWMAADYFETGNDDFTHEMWSVFEKLEMAGFKTPHTDFGRMLDIPNRRMRTT